MQHLQKKRQRLSVEDFGKYLESKTGRPETGLMVLSHTVRSDWTSVVFTIIDLPREFARAAAQPMSLVAQTDFTGELVVFNLKLGIIGAAAYHCHADGQDYGQWREAILTKVEVQLQIAKRAQELCKEQRKAKRQKQEEEFNRECAKAIQESLNIFDAAWPGLRLPTITPGQGLPSDASVADVLAARITSASAGGTAPPGSGRGAQQPQQHQPLININPAPPLSNWGGPVNNPAAPVSNPGGPVNTMVLRQSPLFQPLSRMWAQILLVSGGESKALVQVSEVRWLCLEEPSQPCLQVHSFRFLNPRPGSGQQRCRIETKEAGSTKLKVFGFSL